MRIIKIKYRRLVNLGNFENASLEAIAEVEPGESEESAFQKLRAWVLDQLNVRE